MNDLDHDGNVRSAGTATSTVTPGDDRNSRRRFLAIGGVGALGVLLSACGEDEPEPQAGGATDAEATPTPAETAMAEKGDLDVLNYALTLEFLETEFYNQVIDSGEITDRKLGEVAKMFRDHEQAHVDALTKTIQDLGGTPVDAPATDFESVLAGGRDMILATAATVENVGAAAYLGQVGNIKNPDILKAALSIHAVEARHAAALNEVIQAGFMGDGPLVGTLPNGAFARPMSKAEVMKAIKPFLA